MIGFARPFTHAASANYPSPPILLTSTNMRRVEVLIWDLGRESRRWEALGEALWSLCLGLEVRAAGALLGLGECRWLALNLGGLEG